MRTSFIALGVVSALLPGCSGAERFESPASWGGSAPVTRNYTDAGFEQWLQGFRSRALAQGISAATFDRALSGVSYDAGIIARDRNQAEFTKTIWEYLDSAVADSRIAGGRAALAQHGAVLDRIEARYGVDKEVVVAVWGLESSYGSYRGSTPIIPAMATLAFDGRRGAFFEEQLVAALKIVQAGDVSPEGMTGSWAGAMGHTQFMPTSYLDYAVDFTGDGKRDIWSDDPTDALASTAAYLARSGWQRGQPWGVEVRLPPGFNMGLVGKGTTRSAGDWAAMGVVPAAGGSLPGMGAASILLPAGVRGPAFLIGQNFTAISRYNASDSYVIGVGHLGDRLAGKGPFQQGWPRGDRALSTDERRELQELLTRRGFDTGGTDGKIGSNTLAALRAWQAAVGMAPDGYASLEVLKRLRAG
ncbi:lytic murein transglycosylase [Frigidibacter mobilis]|uniref:Membrane bound lytic murein transglycosylase B n=1 Tax=Frigidibacter mobilis TaxID=1335048 RepID=A0A159Z993_9RHOB|nr:lytic murein transglycosylase [Frigidibacter mobilis]AMY71358.1 membrane bound lytic murein transglycosylase B [Frigidibacter mobilis]